MNPFVRPLSEQATKYSQVRADYLVAHSNGGLGKPTRSVTRYRWTAAARTANQQEKS